MTPPSFRLRSETIALLRYIDEQEFPVSASELSGMLGMHDVPMRRRLAKLNEAGFLGMEQRYIRGSRTNNRILCKYYWATANAKIAIRARPDIETLVPKAVPIQYLINNVFSLGAFADAR